MSFFLTLQNVSILFLLILVGYVVGRLKIITPQGQREITKLVLFVTMPATIIMAMQVPFSMEKVHNILIIQGTLICCYLGIYLISSFITSFFKCKENQKDIYKISMLLSNTCFMGYPIIEAVLGREELFYAVICAGLIFETVSWVFGTYIIGRSVNKRGENNLKKAILNPGVISILVGLLFFLTNSKIPDPIRSTMNMLSRSTSALAMIVVGLILSNSNIGDAFKNKKIYIISLFKLIINPLIIVFVLKSLKFSGIRLVLPVIALSMPSAAYVAMFSDNLGNDKNLAGQLVFVCSLFSLVTIPFIVSIVR